MIHRRRPICGSLFAKSGRWDHQEEDFHPNQVDASRLLQTGALKINDKKALRSVRSIPLCAEINTAYRVLVAGAALDVVVTAHATGGSNPVQERNCSSSATTRHTFEQRQNPLAFRPTPRQPLAKMGPIMALMRPELFDSLEPLQQETTLSPQASLASLGL